jgi:hypothetical protein
MEKEFNRAVKRKNGELNNALNRQAEINPKAPDLFVTKGYDATSMTGIVTHCCPCYARFQKG